MRKNVIFLRLFIIITLRVRYSGLIFFFFFQFYLSLDWNHLHTPQPFGMNSISVYFVIP